MTCSRSQAKRGRKSGNETNRNHRDRVINRNTAELAMAVCEATEGLTHRLRRLLFPQEPVYYQSYTEGQISLKVVLQQVHTLTSTARSSSQRGVVMYAIHLLRRVILAQFQLLCISEEVEKDIPYAYGEWRAICEAAESFNQQFAYSQKSKCACQCSLLSNGLKVCLCGMDADRLQLKFVDFAGSILITHSKRVIAQLLHDPNPKTVFQVVKFESSFIRALLGIFETYTTFFREHRMAYVSEEAFSLVEEGSQATWLDCLIPGAQSEVLRRSEQMLVAQLWNRVAAGVVASLQPMHSQSVDAFSAKLMSLAQQESMEYHSAAVKCLRHIATVLEQQKALSLWDSGFQNMLAASELDIHRDYRAQQSMATATTHTLLAQTLPPSQHLSDRLVTMGTRGSREASSMAQHVDLLSQSQLLCVTLNASVTAVAVFLFQGFSAAFCKWKLRVIAQLLFVDGPMVCRMFDMAISQAGHVCSPQFTFPPSSKLHMLEWSSCEGYSLTHRTKTKMKEVLEGACTTFHNSWSHRCANTLTAVFPCLKFWRSLGKTNHFRQELSPSGYCEVVIEQLLLPVIDTARALSLEPQKAFVGLTVCSLMNEFRRIVTSNKKAYRPAAGRQLLTDYRHIVHWLKSGGQGLHSDTTGLLASLPSLLEIEHGLLLICGTADHFQLPPTAASLRDTLLVATSNLTLLSEQAWYTTHDWIQCID